MKKFFILLLGVMSINLIGCQRTTYVNDQDNQQLLDKIKDLKDQLNNREQKIKELDKKDDVVNDHYIELGHILLFNHLKQIEDNKNKIPIQIYIYKRTWVDYIIKNIDEYDRVFNIKINDVFILSKYHNLIKSILYHK